MQKNENRMQKAKKKKEIKMKKKEHQICYITYIIDPLPTHIGIIKTKTDNSDHQLFSIIILSRLVKYLKCHHFA